MRERSIIWGVETVKGYIIDCDYLIRAIDYLPDNFEIVEIPIISIDTGIWDYGEYY